MVRQLSLFSFAKTSARTAIIGKNDRWSQCPFIIDDSLVLFLFRSAYSCVFFVFSLVWIHRSDTEDDEKTKRVRHANTASKGGSKWSVTAIKVQYPTRWRNFKFIVRPINVLCIGPPIFSFSGLPKLSRLDSDHRKNEQVHHPTH